MSQRRGRFVPSQGLPLGLLGMLVLVGLFEAAVDRRMPDLMNESAHNWWWTNWAASRPPAVDSQILALGSSLSRHGVAPTVIEAQTGRSMWNLSVLGGRPVNAFYTLQHALAAGAHPRAIVLDTDLITWDATEYPSAYAHVLAPAEAAEMAWTMRDADFLASFASCWLLPSVRCRHEVRAAIMDYWRGTASPPHRQLAEIKDRNWKANRGVTIQPATTQMDPNAAAAIDRLPPNHWEQGRWEPQPFSVTYLDRLLDLAARREIPVFWVLPPRYKTLARSSELPNWHGLQRRFIRERVSRFPNVTVIDGLTVGYDRDALIDAIHVNRRGAVAWSLALGQVLRDRLNTPIPADPAARWVALPQYSEPPVETMVEDTAQSAGYLVIRHVAAEKRAAELAAAASTSRH